MMLKDEIMIVAESQREELLNMEIGTERKVLDKINLKLPHASIIAGIRRCGKSTLLRQLIKKHPRFYYFNFEDPRAVNFELSDFQKLSDFFDGQYGEKGIYFFDEIQNIEKWELFVRTMLDKKKKFVITGSNSSLLSRELGSRLTGRHIRHELFPFSFKEAAAFLRKKPNQDFFEEYLKSGGFPEYLKYRKEEILHELLNDIIARDILVRHKLRSEKTIKELAVYLLTNVGKEFSYNSLAKTFGLKSVNSAKSFFSFFEESYLLFVLPRFDYSLTKQQVSPKKIYSIDNGLSSANSATFSSDSGRLLENLVFTHLKRTQKNIFYFREKGECDFLIKEKGKITSAIQVCYELNESNKMRELQGLTEALNKFKLDEGLILTYAQEDHLEWKGKKITVLPTWKWLAAQE